MISIRYNSIKFNDVANAPGIAVSIYLQGCNRRCKGCFNPETWDFNGGQEFTNETLRSIIEGLTANNIPRSLCILGGEPLCPENEFLTYLLIFEIKKALPETKVYIWTGYFLEELVKMSPRVQQILEIADYLIDGPFIEEQKDLTLKMRGSSNQRIWELDKIKKI